MSGQIITVEGIGEVLFCKKNHVRQMSIKMRPFQPIQLTYPARVSGQVALNYILSKQDWVNRTRKKIQQIEKKASDAQQLIIHEHQENIVYEKTRGEKLKVRLSGENIRISIPSTMGVNHPSVSQAVKSGIMQKLRNRAKIELPRRVEVLAKRHGFSYNQIFIKNMRTRWGSCSYANNINLSMFLINLPEHLIDYVVLHELVHTVHKNHRKEFWDRLESVCPGSANYVKEIKQYQFLVLN